MASDVPALAASSSVSDTDSDTAPTATPAALLLPRQSAPSYTCTPSFNATSLLTIFDTWMSGTNTDLGARILLLTLSLRPAATTNSSSSAAAAALTAPPQPLTSTLKSANILADAYTPTQLLSDRRNLNGSWYDDSTTTNSTYFTTLFAADNTASTPDGWPSESYLEFKLGKRVLVTFGNVSAAVAAVYDPAATGDDAAIFPAGYIGAPPPYNTSTPAPHCFYNPSNTSIAAGNSSWAQALYRPSSSSSSSSTNITALINCGYSTLLDPSVAAANTTSIDTRFHDYEAHIRATAAWAWADTEPHNTTGRKPSFRCAAMRVADGRWFVADCNEWRRGACRVDGQPYDVYPPPFPSLPTPSASH